MKFTSHILKFTAAAAVIASFAVCTVSASYAAESGVIEFGDDTNLRRFDNGNAALIWNSDGAWVFDFTLDRVIPVHDRELMLRSADGIRAEDFASSSLTVTFTESAGDGIAITYTVTSDLGGHSYSAVRRYSTSDSSESPRGTLSEYVSADTVIQAQTSQAPALIIPDVKAPVSDIRWSFDNGTLKISGHGSIDSFDFKTTSTDLGRPWEAYRSSITRIEIGEGITDIGSSAFAYFTSLSRVSFPSTLEAVGDNAFSHCYALKGVILPKSLKSVGDGAFENCSKLVSVVLPESTDVIGDRAFYGCYGLENMYVNNPAVSVGASAFENCVLLQSFTASGIRAIGDRAFCGCARLQYITVNGTDACTLGSHCFDSCISLTSVKLSKNIAAIGSYAFSNCQSITAVSLPHAIESVSEGMFKNCTSLKSVAMPVRVTSVGDYAFHGCSGLTDITFSASTKSVGKNAFSLCTALKSVTLPEGTETVGELAFAGCTALSKVSLPSTVTSVGSYAFGGCTALRSAYVGRRDGSFDRGNGAFPQGCTVIYK